MALTMLSVTSCALVDFDFDEKLQGKYDMHISNDTVFVMLGDTFSLSTVFSPDSKALTAVQWATTDDSIVAINGNVFTAVRPGTTYVTATSVYHNVQDSCFVQVMKWDVSPYQYPQETIFYAQVTVDDDMFDPDFMTIAAFINGECRGLGELKKYGDVEVVQFRVWGEVMATDGPEIIRFRIYRSDNLLCDFMPYSYFFDGETHGTLSSPVVLEYSSNKQ
jgi:hypothetical protein